MTWCKPVSTTLQDIYSSSMVLQQFSVVWFGVNFFLRHIEYRMLSHMCFIVFSHVLMLHFEEKIDKVFIKFCWISLAQSFINISTINNFFEFHQMTFESRCCVLLKLITFYFTTRDFHNESMYPRYQIWIYYSLSNWSVNKQLLKYIVLLLDYLCFSFILLSMSCKS